MEVQVLCFAPSTGACLVRLLTKRVPLFSALLCAWALTPERATAHEGDDPAAHVSMPTQITAGLTSLCPMKVSSELREASAIACFGGEVTLAFSPVPEARDTFAVRLRFGYARPLLSEETEHAVDLFATFHEFRALASPEYVAVRFGDTLNLAVGPSLGFEGALVGPDGEKFLPAIHVGGAAAVRGFVTYHTGFFAETSFGAGFYLHETADLASRSLGRITLGWIDRF